MMMVIKIRNQPKIVEVIFSESARFYNLSRAHPNFAVLLQRLEDSLAGNSAVNVLLNGNAIIDVQ